MRPNSIRARMTLGFALFTSLLMLAVCAAFFIYTKHADRSAADARLSLAKREILRELREKEQSLDRPAELLRDENDDLRAADVAILVRDARGRTVAQTVRDSPRWPPHGDSWRTTQFQAGSHTIVLGVEWNSIEVALRERTLFLLGLGALVVAFSSLGAWVLVGRTLSPIHLLALQADMASAESLNVRLETPSPDAEIVSLVSTLNDLLARLGETAAVRGRFYAAASHELRTPLQALNGHLEVALSRPRPADEYRDALDEAHDQAGRLTSLVQDLLLLNQLDTSTSCPPGVQLDIADMCVNELAPLRDLAAERGLTLELTLPDSCEIVAPWNHATMLLRNLLENAVKYAAPDGTVRLQLSQETLILCNDSQHQPLWEADKYFEPFFRPDASRNSETGGNGLGLAIAKAIADTNGWSLSLTQRENVVCAEVCFSGEIV